MKKISLLCSFYFFIIFSLLLYSYTQVDLSLTLSRASVYQTIEKYFQHIGYFQRPVSAELYIGLLVFLFVFYGIFLRLAAKNSITRKQIWTVILVTTGMLFFSYNAFSYDLFNYIFDAKIITHYHQNPYLHKALDFPSDPMLSFMRWTHRVYPYGPIWLAVTVPLSFIGLQFFLPTFFLFKCLMAAAFLGSVYYIEKILQKIHPKQEVFGMVLFALNPLVLIESLVSAHNDIVMIVFSLAGFYFLLNKKYLWAFFFLLLSIGIKFVTVFLLPFFLFILFLQIKHKQVPWEKIFLLSTILMIPAIIFVSVKQNFQPWYLLFALPYAIFLGKKYYIVIPLITLALFFLGEYVPYIFYGDYNPPVPAILSGLTLGGVICSVLGIVVYYVMSLRRVKS